MQVIRKSNERGTGDHGWLKSRHTFSFAEYYDPSHMGFSVLRVINEDRIMGGSGFSTHPHRDMEIISYVVSGALEHKDSMGNSTIIKPGEVQRMSAGTGIRHSEMNHLKTEETHFLQIWILPDRVGVEPGYGQKDFSKKLESNNLVLALSKSGRDDSILINQDIELFVGKLNPGQKISLALDKERKGWIQLIEGNLDVEGLSLSAGDGSALSDIANPSISARGNAHFLFFNLP